MNQTIYPIGIQNFEKIRLFPREKGAVRGTGHGEAGERVDQVSDLAFRLEYLPLRRP